MRYALRAAWGRLVAPALVAGVLTLAAESLPRGLDLESPDRRRSEAILDYIALRNPDAPLDRLGAFPGVLLAVSREVGLDHCLALAQAEVESSFWPDAVGKAGEVGLFQILPSTAALLGHRAAELFDTHLNTRVALTYLGGILARRPALRDALAEYNGGPRNRSPYYALTVLENYARVLRHAGLACEPQRNPEFAGESRRNPRLARGLGPAPAVSAPAASGPPHAGQATSSNFWSDRTSRGGFSRLPLAVHATSAT